MPMLNTTQFLSFVAVPDTQNPRAAKQPGVKRSVAYYFTRRITFQLRLGSFTSS